MKGYFASLVESFRVLIAGEGFHEFVNHEILVLVGAVASLVVLGAAKLGILIDNATVYGVLAPFALMLVGRAFVFSPASMAKLKAAAKR